jgi:hypothetical protein
MMSGCGHLGKTIFNQGGQVVKNTLGDLNNYLFEQLDKLGDEDLTGDELDSEIRRSEAMAKVSEQIIRTGELQFKAMQHMDEYGYDRPKAIPEMLEVRPHQGGGK